MDNKAQEYLTRAQQVIRANNSAQEPVAWISESTLKHSAEYRNRFDDAKSWAEIRAVDRKTTNCDVPLYTHPAPSNGMDKPLFARVVPWQGLSDDEMMKTIEICEDKCGRHLIGGIMIARAIEQALKEKNHG